MARIVGLTGGIGSGKSTVARMFAELGADIIDADELAREAVAPGSTGLSAVAARFGRGVLDAGGGLDRKKLAAIVFGDDAARADLNAIVHPEVSALAARRMAERIDAGARLIVYDVPLLYETGLDRMFPEVIVVTVSAEAQRARVAARDGSTSDEINARIRAQLPLEEKVRRASHVIDSSGTLEETRGQVRALWRKLTDDQTNQANHDPTRR